jgi:hypothetical protein
MNEPGTSITSMRPGWMTTRELLLAIDAEPEGTDRWRALCAEAYERAGRKAFPRSRVPASYEPRM